MTITAKTLRLTPEKPYDFEVTAAFAARFNDHSGADHFSGGVYTRAIELRFQPLIFSLHSVGSVELPELALDLEHASGLLDSEVVFSARLTAGRMMGIRQKLDDFYRMAEVDWTLREVVSDLNGLRVPQASSLFEAMVQVALARGLPRSQGERLREEIVERFGQSIAGRGFTLNAFPTERALIDGARQLRSMNRQMDQRSNTIVAIAKTSLAGELDRESFEGVDDLETRRFLCQLPGVDRWMADWAMVFGLGRMDVLPADEPAMRRAVALMTGHSQMLAPEKVSEFGARWKPWRSLAATYIIAAMRLGRDYWSK